MRVPIKPEEVRQLGGFIHQLTGLYLDQRKSYLFEYRLSPLLEELGLSNYRELYDLVKHKGGEAREKLISAITTDETSFFRDPEYYRMLTEHLLPALINKKRQSGISRPYLNIWCAACSRGQEPYSLAMILTELLEDQKDLNVSIVATDISQKVIDYASRGRYSKFELSRGLTLERLQRHFTQDDRYWRIRDEVRAKVSFRKINILERHPGLGNFDLVLCRNVAVYFDTTDRKRLFTAIAQHMAADGYLVVGSTETLMDFPWFRLQSHTTAQYYVLDPTTGAGYGTT